MSTTLVSILMPVKNADRWLTECLDSVLSQHFSDWELIAVDDSSNDQSWIILEEYAGRDERIKPVKNSGAGITPALELAFTRCKGEFITRMDADDIMPPEKLQRFAEQCTEHPDAIITGKVKYFSKKKISKGYLEYERWLNDRVECADHWQWVYRECVIASANWMTHRKNVQFGSCDYPEDYDLVFQWYKNDLAVKGVDAVTHLWREHDKRTSKNSQHYDQNSFFNLKLKRFVESEYVVGRPIAVMGDNKKTKIINQWLSNNNIVFNHVTLDELHQIAELDNPLVIVGVFPAPELRDGISDFLAGFSLEMGRDWWWF